MPWKLKNSNIYSQYYEEVLYQPPTVLQLMFNLIHRPTHRCGRFRTHVGVFGHGLPPHPEAGAQELVDVDLNYFFFLNNLFLIITHSLESPLFLFPRFQKNAMPKTRSHNQKTENYTSFF